MYPNSILHLSLKVSLYWYFGAQVYTIWVHGSFGRVLPAVSIVALLGQLICCVGFARIGTWISNKIYNGDYSQDICLEAEPHPEHKCPSVRKLSEPRRLIAPVLAVAAGSLYYTDLSGLFMGSQYIGFGVLRHCPGVEGSCRVEGLRCLV